MSANANNDAQLPSLALPNGERVPRLGQGTWRMGENPGNADNEINALRAGIDRGMRLIDTAEMYGEGGAEEIVASAIDGRRDDIFLVSKVYPHNAGRTDAIKACERSLRRLKVDVIDLYLLHWRGSVPFAQTIEAFEKLVDAGKIRQFGVSNFDVDDLEQWVAISGGEKLATNQILYNLGRRWSEWQLQDWCEQQSLPVMAYTPLEPASGRGNPLLDQIASSHNCTAAQIALAWVLRRPNIIAIPKAASVAHVEQNAAAFDITLSSEDLDALDQVWPAPDSAAPIEMI